MDMYLWLNEKRLKSARQIPLVQKQASVCYVHTLFLYKDVNYG